MKPRDGPTSQIWTLRGILAPRALFSCACASWLAVSSSPYSSGGKLNEEKGAIGEEREQTAVEVLHCCSAERACVRRRIVIGVDRICSGRGKEWTRKKELVYCSRTELNLDSLSKVIFSPGVIRHSPVPCLFSL